MEDEYVKKEKQRLDSRPKLEANIVIILKKFLYLFYDKESDNFPTHSAEFSNQTLFSKPVKVASVVYCSLIKHAK